MDLVTLLLTVPKAALFFLIIVGGAIVAEIVYFKKKEEAKIPEVSLPTTSQPSQSPTGTIAPATAPAFPASLSLLKSFFSPKLFIPLLFVVFILASLPAVMVLVKQRAEIRKQAAGEQYPEGCCFNEEDGNYRNCPAGQSCNIPNGACGPGGKSCNPEGVGFHKACVNDQCVNVPGAGTDSCTSNEQCQTSPPPAASPTPPPGCTEPKDCPFGQACDYGSCTPCSAFNNNEGRCHTHARSCHWEAGQCKPGPLPEPGPGTCEINCSATSTGVSVTVKPGKETDCAGAQVTATWYASTCSGTSGWCSGPTQTRTQALPFNEGMMGHPGDCSWQSDVSASTNKGGSCQNSNHGTLPCQTATAPPSYSAQCRDSKRVYDTNWNQITNLASLKPGQTVYFTVSGETTHPQGLTKARFKINGGTWQETTNKHGNDFYIQYTLPSLGSYKVEAMVFNPVLGWW